MCRRALKLCHVSVRILTRALSNHSAFCPPGPHLSKQGIPHMPMMAAAQGNPKSSNYKTRICLNWHKTGHCQYAARCNFAHGHMELRVGMDKVCSPARLLDCTWSLLQSVLQVPAVTYCGSCRGDLDAECTGTVITSTKTVITTTK